MSKTPATCNTSKLSLSSLNSLVQEQSKEIDELKQILKFQQSQIGYLMSLFGINECPVQLPPGITLSSSSPLMSMQQGTRNKSSLSAVEVRSSQSSSQDAGDASSSAALTYAKVTSNSISQIPLAKQFTKTIVSAVYRDLDDNNRRARNVIINGLPKHGEDASEVRSLLTNEFGPTYDVLKVRRLGKPRDDKIQPLLVVLDNPDQSASLIQRAKLLRQSTNEHVRRFVFINADVTRAEALASFQKRCERRERQKSAMVAPGKPSIQQPVAMDVIPAAGRGGTTVSATSSQLIDVPVPSTSNGGGAGAD